MGVGGQRHAPAALPPGRRPGTHCIGGWVGPRADLDECGKSRPHGDSIPVARRYTVYAIPAPQHKSVFLRKLTSNRELCKFCLHILECTSCTRFICTFLIKLVGYIIKNSKFHVI